MNNTDNLKSGFFWNTLAGLVNASEAVITLMVVTRVIGLEMAGVVTIAFSVGNLAMTVGKYGMRNFQVTDIGNRFSFNDYFSSRVVTVALMLGLTVLYLLYGAVCLDYSPRKTMVVFLICFIYMIESIEDVFWGDYQKNGRLDYGGKSFTFRWSIQLGVIVVLLLISRDVVTALSAACVCGTIFMYLYNKRIHVLFQKEAVRFEKTKIASILYCCFPLFLTGFFSMYVVNSPKYAIDVLLDEQSQACYGFVAMPVFVVQLLSNFLYQPILLDLANVWENRNFPALKRMIGTQCVLIVVLTVCCEIGASFLGIPFLNLLYSTDLYAYKPELLILLCGGGFLALGTLSIVVMTTLRIQSKTIWAYGITSILAFCFSRTIVRAYGTAGAACLYSAMEAFTAVMLWRCTISYIKSESNQCKKSP